MTRFLRLLGLGAVLLMAAGTAGAQAPTWYTQFSDSFGRPDVAAGAAGSSVVGNGWTDVYGGIWGLSGHQLVGTKGSGNYNNQFLLRPTSEADVNQRVVLTVPAGSGGASFVPVFRYAPGAGSSSGVLMFIDWPGGARVDVYHESASAGLVNDGNSSAVTFNSAHGYTIDAGVYGTTTTTAYCTITDTTTSTTLLSYSVALTSTAPTAAGVAGVSIDWNSPVKYQNITIYQGDAAPVALAPGNVTVSQTGAGALTLTAAGSSGGISPYSYAWQRSTSPSSGFAALTSTTTTEADTGLTPGTVYYYRFTQTDSSATPQSVTTLLPVRASATAYLNGEVGIIGDSICKVGYPGSSAPDYFAVSLAKLAGVDSVSVVNQGQPGSVSADWVPGAGSGYLSAAETAFASAGVKYVNVMLGTNDASNGTSYAVYRANMAAMLSDLTGKGYVAVLNYPPAFWPSVTSTANTAHLTVIEPAIDSLVNGKTILRGDTRAYDFFLRHQSESSDGTHPTTTGGTADLGLLWANGWSNALFGPVAASTGPNPYNRTGTPGNYHR